MVYSGRACPPVIVSGRILNSKNEGGSYGAISVGQTDGIPSQERF